MSQCLVWLYFISVNDNMEFLSRLGIWVVCKLEVCGISWWYTGSYEVILGRLGLWVLKTRL